MISVWKIYLNKCGNIKVRKFEKENSDDVII
jgi:hypothetical protein